MVPGDNNVCRERREGRGSWRQRWRPGGAPAREVLPGLQWPRVQRTIGLEAHIHLGAAHRNHEPAGGQHPRHHQRLQARPRAAAATGTCQAAGSSGQGRAVPLWCKRGLALVDGGGGGGVSTTPPWLEARGKAVLRSLCHCRRGPLVEKAAGLVQGRLVRQRGGVSICCCWLLHGVGGVLLTRSRRCQGDL